MSDPIYRIKDWSQHFENSRSRVVENLRWVSVPNRHDGEGYSIVMEQENAAELFAAWVLIIQVASKCRVRGTLTRDDGTPLTARALSLKTKAPERWFINALDFFTHNTLWLECEGGNSEESLARHLTVTCPSPIHDPSAEGEEGRGGEGGDTLAASDSQTTATAVKIRWSKEAGFENITERHRKQWQEAFPACDLKRQIAAMNVWLLNNPAKARKSNWGNFISKWLSREQDRGGDLRSQPRQKSEPEEIIGFSSPRPQPDLDELFSINRIARERDEETERIAGDMPVEMATPEEMKCF
jgi:hypothetical protein